MADHPADYSESLRRALTMVVAALEQRANERSRAALNGAESVEEAIAALDADTQARAEWINSQVLAVALGIVAAEAKGQVN